MPVNEDTEITLGTGKLLAVFFGLVMVCAVFFAMGFSLGRSANKTGAPSEAQAATPTPTPAKASASNSSMSFYKAVQSKTPDQELEASTDHPSDAAPQVKSVKSESKSQTRQAKAKPAPEAAAPVVAEAPVKGPAYYVQIAAVKKQEDANALVDALKRKRYAAFSITNPADKFFHVQIGPLDAPGAEAMRTKLIAAGYTPILKK
jgi:DedD protein